MRYTRGGFQPVLGYSQFFLLPVTSQLSAECGPWMFDSLVHVVGNLETLHRFLNSVWRMDLRTLHSNIQVPGVHL